MKRFFATIFIFIPIGLILFSLLMVTALKWVPVAYTPLMLKRSISSQKTEKVRTEYDWVPLDEISVNMVRAVMASEDQKFLTHNGFDLDELTKMQEAHLKRGKPIRGCSTISQQTAKNCFTFCSHTWLRKGVEAYYTLLIEKIWGKRRIMEVYLNVAEMGPGIYGVEAAAQHYYHIPASKLSLNQAATLACCLPNPLRRNPDWVGRHMASRRAQIVRMSGYISVVPLYEDVSQYE